MGQWQLWYESIACFWANLDLYISATSLIFNISSRPDPWLSQSLFLSMSTVMSDVITRNGLI